MEYILSIGRCKKIKQKNFEIHHKKDLNALDISPHCHDNYEIFILLSKNIDYIVERTMYNLQAKDFLLISPGQHHYPVINKNCKKYEIIVINISKEFIEMLSELDSNVCYSFNECAKRKNNLVRLPNNTWQTLYLSIQWLLEEVRSEKIGKNLECNALLTQLLVALNRFIYFQKSFELVEHSEKLINNVAKYIINNANKDLNLEKIASHFYVSQDYLSHLFKEKMGISIYKYVIQRRLIIAKNNILSNVPVSKVHEQCGFKDYAGFYRAFKKEFGLSPKEFKKFHYNKLK